MAPPFPRASIELDYPLYAVDFDPEDSTRLVVGGGGGAGRSGVGNKIVSWLLSMTSRTVANLGRRLFSRPCHSKSSA